MIWFDCHASAVQAISALVAITGRYASLTKKLVKTAAAQLQTIVDAQKMRRRELRTSVEILMLGLASLPVSSQRPQADRMIRESIGWNDFDFGRFRMLAAEVSTKAGANAAVVESKMKYVAEQVDRVKGTSIQTGVNWGMFAWEPWEAAIHDAQARLDLIGQNAAD